MTKAKSKAPTPAEKRLREWLGDVAGAEMMRYLRTARRSKDNALVYPNLERRIMALSPPLHLSPPPDVKGAVFDPHAVNHFLNFCRRLRHMKGNKWAGRRLELELWQVIFVVAPVFGWRSEDGRRIRRTLYLEVPKKNGKSTLAAALALYLLIEDGEQGAEVVAVAGDREQAKAVFDVAFNMGKVSSYAAERLRFMKNQIIYERSLSWLKVLSADGDLKAGLNIHGAIVDELLVQRHRKLVDNLEGATGARSQPLIAYLTTAGLDETGSVYHEKRSYSERVSAGEVRDDSWHAVIYAADAEDDWKDPAIWAKVNPGLGVSVQADYLARRAAQAQASPASKNTFLRDHLCMRTGQVTRWLDVQRWDESGAAWPRPIEAELRGAVAFGGLDLASTTDLAAFTFVVPMWEVDPDRPDEMIETLAWFCRAWTPADTLEERADRDMAPYRQWVEAGCLQATPGDVIDYDTIEAEVFALAEHFDFRRLHFDRWGSKQLIQHLADEIGHDIVWDMGQGFASMSPAMKEVERLILQGRVRHGGNPLLRSALTHLAVISDPAGNIKPDRSKSTGRIDPFVAGAMAVDAWTRGLTEVSAYERNESA